MKLTGRQREFLSRFLDLYHKENHKPLHYSVVAEYLGIRPVTAYDMLRLLQERGLVTSEYTLPRDRGRGRSSILFAPTQKAVEMVQRLSATDLDLSEWITVKEHILQALREGKDQDYNRLLEEILTRIPKCRSPMLYATEMISAVLLSLYLYLTGNIAANSVFRYLHSSVVSGELWLNAIAGLTLSLFLTEQASRRITSTLLSYSKKYQEQLGRLSAENKSRLSEFAQEVIQIIGARIQSSQVLPLRPSEG